MKTLTHQKNTLKRTMTPFLILLGLLCYAPLANGQGSTGTLELAADTDNTGDGDIRFKAGPDVRMIMKDNGNLGIGTTSPTAPLHIKAVGGNPENNGLYVHNPSNGAAVVAARVTGATADPYFSLDILGVGGWSIGIDNSDGDKLKFGKSWDNITDGNILVIDRSGNIGVGTSAPSAKLSVMGDIHIQHNKKVTSEGIVNFQADSDNSGDGIFNFWAGPNIRMTMADNGNLGLGTTSPQGQLHIQDLAAPGAKNLVIGDDVFFSDIDVSDLIGLYGNANSSRGGLKLGSTGPVLWGENSVLTVGGRIKFGDTEYIEAVGSNDAVLGASLRPSLDASYSLGSGSHRWTTIYATNPTINTSDRRDKNNIEKLSYGLEEVMQMRPVSYNWKKMPEQGTQVGFIAQDLNRITPDIVFDPAEELQQDENGNWVPVPVTEKSRFGIQYALLTPILVNAIQEQQASIDDLKFQVEKLQNSLQNQTQGNTSKLGFSGTASELADIAKLYPNVPNPFREETEIRYYLPQSVAQASLHIFDLQGHVVKEIALNQRGESSLQIDGYSLTPGMYIYTLIADGQEIDSRRMILTD